MNLNRVHSWSYRVFSLELRKVFSYRADFWIGFIGSTIADMGLAYFLWKSVYDTLHVNQIRGLGFSELMMFYLLISQVGRIIKGQDWGFLSQDIYQGGLTRYLVYPVSYFQYKWVQYMANAVIYTGQLFLALGIYVWIFGLPETVLFSLQSVVMGLMITFAAGTLYFMMSACLEMVAFWQENVWSLLVMLKFGASFLGGAMIPLAFYPPWSQSVLGVLPFRNFGAFPLDAWMGKLTASEFFFGYVALLAWILFFWGLSRLIWRYGSRVYTGVGQ